MGSLKIGMITLPANDLYNSITLQKIQLIYSNKASRLHSAMNFICYTATLFLQRKILCDHPVVESFH